MSANNRKQPSKNSSRSKTVKWVILALQLVLAAIFLWSAVSKFMDIFTFGEILRSYKLLPAALIKPLAILLPIAEFFVGVGLLIRPAVNYAAWGVIALSLAFMIGLIFNYGEVLPYGCGCFGPEEAAAVGIWDVGKDVLFIAGAVLLLVLNRKKALA
ncbi:methylamine utilization protein MauE [Tumebacillus sp. BK434]|uniref:MauE/DoxX family redox-associated membrane protein n=1 Tax=Tumebacillus sp. BK434 TaxID=2512169 RepID=UPI0010EFDD43|nr:MauE/DoxX family redox-associated membrane protein [Tumebacillus sp. BK434]TCP55458.1 methylamine utilization protein MauE [Tumebacillus sp. BK434]